MNGKDHLTTQGFKFSVSEHNDFRCEHVGQLGPARFSVGLKTYIYIDVYIFWPTVFLIHKICITVISNHLLPEEKDPIFSRAAAMFHVFTFFH